MKNIKPTPTGEAQEVKIKVRINSNGVIQLTSANVVDKKPKEETPVDNGNTETNNMEVNQEVSALKRFIFMRLNFYFPKRFVLFQVCLLMFFYFIV